MLFSGSHGRLMIVNICIMLDFNKSCAFVIKRKVSWYKLPIVKKFAFFQSLLLVGNFLSETSFVSGSISYKIQRVTWD